ncbi:MAG: glycosyltransferase [Candidatus Phlomobacter fragariae]
MLPKIFNCIEQQKLKNWEIILVNDGSTDNRALLLEECIERFPNTNILHQESLGVSVARNVGMNIATGKYITFLDIDDISHLGMYNRLLALAKLGDLDVAMCNGTYVYMDCSPSKLIFPLKRVPSTGIMSGIEWL